MGTPSPLGSPWSAPGKAPLLAGGGTFLSPLFPFALGVRLAGSAEWGLRSPQVPPVGRLERRPSQAAGMPPLLRAWKGAAPGRRGDFPVPPLSVCAWGSIGGKRGVGTPFPPGPPCRAPGKAPLPGGRNAAAPRRVKHAAPYANSLFTTWPPTSVRRNWRPWNL